MYTLKLALLLLHPGPFQLITVTSNVLWLTTLITSLDYMIDKIVHLNFITSYLQLKLANWLCE